LVERTLVWFRNDLRLSDNIALAWASANSRAVIPVFVSHFYTDALGAATKWFLHHSLSALSKDLARHGLQLLIVKGDPAQVLLSLCQTFDITAVVWNREYEPTTIERDRNVKTVLKANNVAVYSFMGNVLLEPLTITKSDGSPYRVFTPFWKAFQDRFRIAASEICDHDIRINNERAFIIPKEAVIKGQFVSLEDLHLLPRIAWDRGFYEKWPDISESGVMKRLMTIVESGLHHTYEVNRNLPAVDGTTCLSPFLRWGLISPKRIWKTLEMSDQVNNQTVEPLLRQLGWREFNLSLLFHFPDSVDLPLDKKFLKFPWKNPSDNEQQRHYWQAWCRGLTGYPIVDAGMRQLWQTGWMHNRVRMIVASFLVKHLLMDWRVGLQWFVDTLVDADLANNVMGWQWVAGCGADAAPYFRIFNPVTQGIKFDPDGAYVKKWVSELSKLSAKHIHQPFEVATEGNYPCPIISLSEGRNRALKAYDTLNLNSG
jgi:deoxyribodipyrimidine photo-lyase